MAERPEPPKRLDIEPGESPWLAMARELARNPDSPASLRIMSGISQALAPRHRASDQVVDALEAQLQQPGTQQDAAVAAAVQHWEREFEETMPADTLAGFIKEAKDRMERQRRQPPRMQDILDSLPEATDTGYQLGIHLEGPQGTWHRLWAIMALSCSFGNDIDHDPGVATVRAQFEEMLGRTMTPEEWSRLKERAVHHARTHMAGPTPP